MSYPSNSDGVAQDHIRAFVDRILRMKEEAKAINADVREIYAEAKGAGYDKTVLGKLVNYVEKRAADANAVMESESIFDLYLTAYDSAKKQPHVHAREEERHGTTQNTSNSGPDEPKNDDLVTAPQSILKTLRANPSMAIVSASEIKKPEPQPLNQAGSDLTSSQANDGQVADIQPETANSSTEERPAEAAHVASEADHENGEAGGRTRALPEGEDLPVDSQPDKPVEPSGSAAPTSKYAERGVITWESAPPEGVIRHEYSHAFGGFGQDMAVIEDDLTNAASAPIVKNGNVILDGWARYMKARHLGIEYPVVQYDGGDSLIDVINWNVGGRLMTDEQKYRVAQKLAKAEPNRKADIYAAFEIGIALA